MNKTIISLSVSCVLIALASCSGGVKTQKGDIYQTIKIDKQKWMVKNLNVSVFRNGDSIPELRGWKDWEEAGKEGRPAWCYYNNNPSNEKMYGKLYNWYTVNDPRGLAPEGWHIPTDNEWKELEMVLGMSQSIVDELEFRGTDEGSKLKGTYGWYEGTIATNSSGFSVLPGGYRSNDGKPDGHGGWAIFWSSTESDSMYVWNRFLVSQHTAVARAPTNKRNGCSVRCIKD